MNGQCFKRSFRAVPIRIVHARSIARSATATQVRGRSSGTFVATNSTVENFVDFLRAATHIEEDVLPTHTKEHLAYHLVTGMLALKDHAP